MDRESKLYASYVDILKHELVPAMGCTEPIALAYGAALARKILGEEPTEATVYASGNIIKNVKSVIVPHTGGLRGIEAACAVGIFFGEPEKGLEVIANVKKDEEKELIDRIGTIKITVRPLETEHILGIIVEASGPEHSALVQIMDEHTNVTRIMRDGRELEVNEIIGKDAQLQLQANKNQNETKNNPDYELDYGSLTVEGIIEFAKSVDLSDISHILERQIECNTAIAEEGLRDNYGASIGQILLKRNDSVETRAKAYAAAGSDARMSGCDMPVIINSGSGNQGLTTSLPVIVYAREYKKSHEELLRALTVANLTTLHLKSGIGRLSAYCGAVSAGVGAAAGIAYMLTKNPKVVRHTIVNALAIDSGIVCDGAKPSCAAKIAMSVDAGLLGFYMYMNGSQFKSGDGLVTKGVENTINNIAILGHDGMAETDKKIIEIMTQEKSV